MGRLLRWSMGQVDGLVGVSEFVAGSLAENGYAREKIHAVVNAIVPADWDYRIDAAPVRQALGIPSQSLVIACAARLFRGKGQDDVIRAMPEIRRHYPEVRLLIVGRDDRHAMRTSFAEELLTLSRTLGLTDNVIFTGHRSDMPNLLAACDVFALPSLEEPLGLVYLEAMAMKKPVVALRSGGVPEVVDHGKSGLLSPVGDANALETNLLSLLRNPGLRVQMGEYGRRQVEHRYTPERMAADVARVYASLLTATQKSEVALHTAPID
jgi:glycosyltransferase involved in cell wall biosynthesis